VKDRNNRMPVHRDVGDRDCTMAIHSHSGKEEDIPPSCRLGGVSARMLKVIPLTWCLLWCLCSTRKEYSRTRLVYACCYAERRRLPNVSSLSRSDIPLYEPR
jgi:hypothetical protein